MLLKDMKVLFPNAKVKTFEGKRVLYMNPDDLFHHLSPEDWAKVKRWNGICILSSPKGKANECFYFYWGYGGTPEYKQEITILEKKNSGYY